jgi:hypothetical protein
MEITTRQKCSLILENEVSIERRYMMENESIETEGVGRSNKQGIAPIYSKQEVWKCRCKGKNTFRVEVLGNRF